VNGWPVKDTGVRTPVSAEVLAEAEQWQQMWAAAFEQARAATERAFFRSEAAKLEALAATWVVAE
jgi:hypothetical protein